MKPPRDEFKASMILMLGLLVLVTLLALFGCASAPPAKPAPAAHPLSAVEISTCGKSIALFVTMDPKHMILFQGGYTALYDAVGPGMPPLEKHTDPVDFQQALDLASRAPLASHVVVPCMSETL